MQRARLHSDSPASLCSTAGWHDKVGHPAGSWTATAGAVMGRSLGRQ